MSFFNRLDIMALLRLTVSAAIIALVGILNLQETRWMMICFVAAAFLAAFEAIKDTVSGLSSGQGIDSRALIIVAATVALFTETPRNGALVALIYESGALIVRFILRQSRRSLESNAIKRPTTANVIHGGTEETVPVDDVSPGSTIIIRPGETVPLDCVVLQGRSSLDLSSVTGKTSPKPISQDSLVPSGAVNLSSPITAHVSTTATESVSARILKIIGAQSTRKGITENAMAQISRGFTAAIVVISVLSVAALPVLTDLSVGNSIQRALAMLVLACPGALSMGMPLAYSAGLYGAARHGILYKSSWAMDMTARGKAIIFDKAGTLTTGDYRVTSVKSDRMDSEMLLRVAAHAEAYSSHPIAKSIIETYGDAVYIELVDSFEEHPGRGVSAVIDGIDILVGNRRFLSSHGVTIGDEEADDQTAVYVSAGKAYVGRILLSDTVKNDSASAARYIHDLGYETTALASGDRAELTGRIARQCEIDLYFPNCLPRDKAAAVLEVRSRVQGPVVAVVGGEDTSILGVADVGVKMGGLSTTEDEAIDAVLMSDNPEAIGTAIHRSQTTQGVALQNAALALCVKTAVLALAAFGLCEAWVAALLDAILSIASVPLAMRAYIK